MHDTDTSKTFFISKEAEKIADKICKSRRVTFTALINSLLMTANDADKDFSISERFNEHFEANIIQELRRKISKRGNKNA